MPIERSPDALIQTGPDRKVPFRLSCLAAPRPCRGRRCGMVSRTGI